MQPQSAVFTGHLWVANDPKCFQADIEDTDLPALSAHENL